MNGGSRADQVAWGGVILFIAWTMGPVLRHWSGSVLGPFGGIDPMLQLGILQWTAGHWWQPAVLMNLPIFYPLHGMLGCMDPLLGQAWLVWPVHLLFQPTAAAQYNLAFLGSLMLAAVGMATLWRTSGGSWQGAGVASLALIGAPYTTAQLGHLNQLPPTLVLFTLAAVMAALRRQDQGHRAGRLWWAVGVCFVLQGAWGWYGFAYAVLGTAVLKIYWLVRSFRTQGSVRAQALKTVRAAWFPALLAMGAVYFLAQPQLQLGQKYPGFTRSETEVRSGSADIQHLWNRGAYRAGIFDWTGHGIHGQKRYENWARQTLHPGWMALLLGVYGWRKRNQLSADQTSAGNALLVAGLVGLVLAFGDSVGIPGTDLRLPLPMEWLRTAVPPFRAFRGAWRFSWLMIIAVAWWAAVGAGFLAKLSGRRRFLAPVAVALMALMSLPAGVPAVAVPVTGVPLASGPHPTGPVLTLPAPINEYAEDRTEALWIARALELGQPVTGGATGWVPPEIVAFRTRLHACETGAEDAGKFMAELRTRGFHWVEIALRPGDEQRIKFWRKVLLQSGAVVVANVERPGYETYRWASH